MLRGRTSDSAERCERAIAVAREVGAKAEEAHALNTLGVDAVNVGDRATGIERLREALRMAEELGEPDDVGRAYVNLSDTLDQDGRAEESVETALEGARRAAELGIREYRLFLEGEAARRLTALGRLDEAHALTEGALELGSSFTKFVLCAARAGVEVHRGHFAEAEPLLDAAVAGVERARDSMWIGHPASIRVELESGLGRDDQARRVAERALELSADHEFVFYTARLYAMAARTEARVAERARAQGDDTVAADAERRARVVSDRLDSCSTRRMGRDPAFRGGAVRGGLRRGGRAGGRCLRRAGVGADRRPVERARLPARRGVRAPAPGGVPGARRRASACGRGGRRRRSTSRARPAPGRCRRRSSRSCGGRGSSSPPPAATERHRAMPSTGWG